MKITMENNIFFVLIHREKKRLSEKKKRENM